MLLIFVILYSSTSLAADGMVSVSSAHSVKDTADKLESILKQKGMTVFIRIDHAEGANKAGIDLNDTELVIFGNPKVGSPLMKCQQSIGIDLPQKALIWKDGNGKVWFSYNDPAHLKARHQVSGCDQVLGKVSNALANFAKAATSP